MMPDARATGEHVVNSLLAMIQGQFPAASVALALGDDDATPIRLSVDRVEYAIPRGDLQSDPAAVIANLSSYRVGFSLAEAQRLLVSLLLDRHFGSAIDLARVGPGAAVQPLRVGGAAYAIPCDELQSDPVAVFQALEKYRTRESSESSQTIASESADTVAHAHDSIRV